MKIRAFKAEPSLKDGDKIYSKENKHISLTYAVEMPSSYAMIGSKIQINVENDKKSFSPLCRIIFTDGIANTTCDYDTEAQSELIESYKDRVEFVYKSNGNIYFKLKQLKASYKYDYEYDQFNRQDVSVNL